MSIIDKMRYEDTREHMQAYKLRKELEKEFTMIINKNSIENDSNTPDFIIAQYLVDCLINFNLTVAQRCVWYNPENI